MDKYDSISFSLNGSRWVYTKLRKARPCGYCERPLAVGVRAYSVLKGTPFPTGPKENESKRYCPECIDLLSQVEAWMDRYRAGQLRPDELKYVQERLDLLAARKAVGETLKSQPDTK